MFKNRIHEKTKLHRKHEDEDEDELQSATFSFIQTLSFVIPSVIFHLTLSIRFIIIFVVTC